MKLKEKVAIITGSGRGIGRAYAMRFVEEGAKIVVADIIAENAQKVAAEIKAKGGDALPIETDVSNESSTVEMAKKTMEHFGKIDILLNNAAKFYGLKNQSWDSWTPKEWDQMFAINVTGVWLCIKAVVPHMITQQKGKIINISSSTAIKGTHQILPYTCSKGAVITLTMCLARPLGQYNININTISPGFTKTEATIDRIGKAGFSDRSLQRIEEPADLVGTAVFLASGDSDFITGQTIAVDGGETLS